jgi:glycosyltransferase involved in cell wall biosynthesis
MHSLLSLPSLMSLCHFSDHMNCATSLALLALLLVLRQAQTAESAVAWARRHAGRSIFPCLAVADAVGRCDAHLEVVHPSPWDAQVSRAKPVQLSVRFLCACPINVTEGPTSGFTNVVASIRTPQASKSLRLFASQNATIDLIQFIWPDVGVFVVEVTAEDLSAQRALAVAKAAFVVSSAHPVRELHSGKAAKALMRHVEASRRSVGATPPTKVRVALLASLPANDFDGITTAVLGMVKAVSDGAGRAMADVSVVHSGCEPLASGRNGALLLREGVTIKNLCIAANPGELDLLREGETPAAVGTRAFAIDAWIARGPQDLHPAVQGAARRAMDMLAPFDVVLAVVNEFPDHLGLRIARWANPHVRTALFLGTPQIFLLPPPFWKHAGASHVFRVLGGVEEAREAATSCWDDDADRVGGVPCDPLTLLDADRGDVDNLVYSWHQEFARVTETAGFVGPWNQAPCAADELIAPSWHVATRPEVHVLGRPIRVVLTGVNTTLLHPDRVPPDPFLLQHVPPDALLVGFAARLSPEKGVAELLVAFARVFRSLQAVPRPDGRLPFLVIAGSASDPLLEDALREWAAALGVSHRVLWLGFVPSPRIFSVLRTLDLLVCPFYTETYGLVAVEAMSLGRAVVHFGARGMSDYTLDGETAIVARPKSVSGLAAALERAIRDDALRERVGRGGRDFADAYLSSQVWDQAFRDFISKPAE